jgi:hypothetical protein
MDTRRLVGATSKDAGTWRLAKAVALGPFPNKSTGGQADAMIFGVIQLLQG